MNRAWSVIAVASALTGCGQPICDEPVVFGDNRRAPGTNAGGLLCLIEADKPAYSAGETARFTVTLKNVGSRTFRAVRGGNQEGEHHAHLLGYADGRAVPCTCIFKPYYGTKRGTVVLKPGDAHQFVLERRQLLCHLERRLSGRHRWMSEKLRLAAEYFVVPYENFPPDHRGGKPTWVNQVAANSPLWLGVARSSPVEIQVLQPQEPVTQ